MSVKLLTEHHLEFLSLKGGCTGSSESTLVKVPHCWKSHVRAHMYIRILELPFYHYIKGPQTVSYSICPNLESIVIMAMYNGQYYFCSLIKT